MHTRSRVDAGNPQAAHIALAITAVAVHIRHRAHHGFVRWTEKTLARTTVALSHLQQFSMFIYGVEAMFFRIKGCKSICLSAQLANEPAHNRREAVWVAILALKLFFNPTNKYFIEGAEKPLSRVHPRCVTIITHRVFI